MGDDALAEIFRMSAPALVAQFERLAGAPGGVARLRELILALAVRGKLVPQRNGDEPAGKFLAFASETRSRMVAEGRLRRTAVVTPVEMSEHAYPLPPGWSWARIGDLGQVVGGGTPKSDIPELWAEAGVPWLTPADLYGRREMKISRGRRDISPRGLSESSAQLLPPGTVLFSSRAPIGYVAIAEAPLATNQGFKSCVPFVEGVSEYLYWHLKQLAPAIDKAASGTTFKEISGADFAAVVIAVPPLAEQARIVARVDELMQLCDALEAKGQLEAQQHARLLETLLGTLTDSTTPEELAANWQRVAEHFDLLLDRPEAVDVLEQTVLQLAVRGLLVAQREQEEPAGVWLERLKKARANIAGARSAGTLPAGLDQVPFPLPTGWGWSSLSELGLITSGATPSKGVATNWLGDIPWVSPKDMKVPIIEDAQDHVSRSALKGSLSLIKPGSLLMVVRGMILAHSFPVAVTRVPVTINQDMKALTPQDSSVLPYLSVVCMGMKSEILSMVERSTHGTCKLDSAKIFSLPIPLPPLDEQARIVARVTELRRLCADLRQRLAASQATQSHLAGALVESVASA